MRGPCRRGVPADVGATGSPPLNRRAALATGLAALAVWGVWPRLSPRGRSPSVFEPLPLPGFRVVRTASPGLTAIALGGGAEPPRPVPDLTGASLCAALFSPGPRPAIAYFLDPQCPICRKMLPDVVAAAGDAGAPLRVQLLTGLGPASDIAARAILAARLQGREADMRDRMSRAMLVTDLNYVRAAAAAIGVDPDRLVADMQAPGVSAELRQAADLARLFGMRGTPATVIGRTLVEGRMSRADMASFLMTEAGENPGPCG